MVEELDKVPIYEESEQFGIILNCFD